MSTIKIKDLAVSGLDPHTKYKFAFENKKVVNSFNDINFFNIKKMQSIKLQ